MWGVERPPPKGSGRFISWFADRREAESLCRSLAAEKADVSPPFRIVAALMPRVQPKIKINPAGVYVAWTSAGVPEAEFPGGVVKRGAEFRGSHPVVKAHPNLFVPVDAPKSEWPSEFAFEVVPEAEEARGARVVEPLPADQLKEATVGLRIGYGGGNYIAKGTRLPKTHPVVVNNPDYFKDVQPEEVN